MNRYASILCVILVGAAGMLFATGAPADEVAFEIYNSGRIVDTGIPSGLPVIECHGLQQTVAPNDLELTRMVAYAHVDALTNEVYGRDVYFTEDGDALFVRYHGTVDFGTLSTTLYQQFTGGTGRFAGARGSATHHCHFVYDEWPCASSAHNDCESHGFLVLSDLEPKMVPMQAHEGDLVSAVFSEVEGEECSHLDHFLFKKSMLTGEGDRVGLYTKSKLELLDLSTMGIHGFFTQTAANGDTLDGYYEGALSPLGDPADPVGVDMQVWIAGGTGRFSDASGQQTGSGLWWLDGREDITLEGVISSVGSSKR